MPLPNFQNCSVAIPHVTAHLFNVSIVREGVLPAKTSHFIGIIRACFYYSVLQL